MINSILLYLMIWFPAYASRLGHDYFLIGFQCNVPCCCLYVCLGVFWVFHYAFCGLLVSGFLAFDYFLSMCIWLLHTYLWLSIFSMFCLMFCLFYLHMLSLYRNCWLLFGIWSCRYCSKGNGGCFMNLTILVTILPSLWYITCENSHYAHHHHVL